MNTKLVSFKREANPYRLILMVDDSIYKLLKDYSTSHRILNHQNKPYQYYLNMGYFEVITNVIKGKVIHQTKVTGKDRVWLLARMKKILRIEEKSR